MLEMSNIFYFIYLINYIHRNKTPPLAKDTREGLTVVGFFYMRWVFFTGGRVRMGGWRYIKF